jgi:hypothetical protein
LDIHAGTATSYRLHAGLPNSFNVLFKVSYNIIALIVKSQFVLMK